MAVEPAWLEPPDDRASAEIFLARFEDAGDASLLGFLFRSTFEQIEREHVIFAVSPRIVQKSELLSEL